VIAAEAVQTLSMRETGMISEKRNSKYQSHPEEANLGGLLEIAIEIASKRRNILHRMRTALLSCNDQEALSCARELCGVEL
jgi:hypothetical protein